MSVLMDDMSILLKNQKLRNTEFMRDINGSRMNMINLEDDETGSKQSKAELDDSNTFERMLNDSVEVTKERRSVEQAGAPTFG